MLEEASQAQHWEDFSPNPEGKSSRGREGLTGEVQIGLNVGETRDVVLSEVSTTFIIQLVGSF